LEGIIEEKEGVIAELVKQRELVVKRAREMAEALGGLALDVERGTVEDGEVKEEMMSPMAEARGGTVYEEGGEEEEEEDDDGDEDDDDDDISIECSASSESGT
jgi:hypothetical protein